jgi:uncharacterized membrane protein (UPF0127 family)
MNFTRRIWDSISGNARTHSDSQLKIFNRTRNTILGTSIQLANSGATRRKGLLGRSGLSPGEGIWIVPCESVHTFWMKFPIDLVYLDRNKKVKKVKSDVRPWRLSACLSAHSVLELVPGTISTTQTKPGDTLEFSPALPQGDCPMSPDSSAAVGSKPRGKHDTGMVMRANKLSAIAEFLVLGICIVTFALTIVGICASVLGSDATGTRDFVEYWASGYQLAHHANPYDRDAILKLERSAGFPSGTQVLIMWNPPPALLLVLPLGFLGPTAANFLWSLLLLASFVAAVRMIWIMHDRPTNQLHWLGYSFAPALACLLAGQVSLFVLLGLVLFLRMHQSNPFLAGVSLWLCLLKPHLFLPFGIVLILWVLITQNFKILLGTAFALGVSTAIVFGMNPLVWAHYEQMMSTMSTARMQQELIPCLSIMLRWIISPKTMWLQYLPAVFGCVWALAYFRKQHKHWDWMEHGSLLMFVSLLVAPYTWLMDQAILIPGLLYAAYLARSRGLLAILGLASAVIEIGIIRGIPLLHSAFYLWTAPAWLAWYLYATKRSYTAKAYDSALVAGAR